MLTLLFVLLLALKIAGLTQISWWVVTSPIWGQAVVALAAAFTLTVVTMFNKG